MPKDIGTDGLDVVGCDEGAPPQECVGARRLRQRDRRARAGTELDERCEIGEARGGRLARRVDDVDDVVHDPLVHVQIGDARPRREHGLGCGSLRNRNGFAARHAAHDLLLLVARRVADAQLEHEAIDLRLRQWIDTFLLDRVLRREDEERLVELEGRSADGHLLFLHRLEQRRLDLRRRAIDLIGEDDVREDRTLLDEKLAGRLIVHLRADDVCRQQIGGELNAAEARVDRLGERAHGERLGEPRHPLQQYVTTGEKADEQPVDHVILADDAPPDLPRDFLYEAGVGRR